MESYVDHKDKSPHIDPKYEFNCPKFTDLDALEQPDDSWFDTRVVSPPQPPRQNQQLPDVKMDQPVGLVETKFDGPQNECPNPDGDDLESGPSDVLLQLKRTRAFGQGGRRINTSELYLKLLEVPSLPTKTDQTEKVLHPSKTPRTTHAFQSPSFRRPTAAANARSRSVAPVKPSRSMPHKPFTLRRVPTKPMSPEFSTKLRTRTTRTKSTEDMEIERVRAEQESARQLARINSAVVSRVLQQAKGGAPVLPKRSVQPLTQPKEFKFQTELRVRRDRAIQRPPVQLSSQRITALPRQPSPERPKSRSQPALDELKPKILFVPSVMDKVVRPGKENQSGFDAAGLPAKRQAFAVRSAALQQVRC